MHRVNAAAADLMRQGYEVKVYIPENFRSVKGNLNKLDLEANRAWLRYWTRVRGATVFDIGIDKTDPERNPFYAMEHRCIYQIWQYKNVIKLPGY